jgi:hypothetical protein
MSSFKQKAQNKSRLIYRKGVESSLESCPVIPGKGVKA